MSQTHLRTSQVAVMEKAKREFIADGSISLDTALDLTLEGLDPDAFLDQLVRKLEAASWAF